MTYVATRDGTKIYTKIWGTGRPVILIHGWPLSSDTWDDVAMPLAENGFQAVSYDRRGFGRSDQPWNGYDYDTLANDLADVISELRLREVTLVGFSMGGGEVARYMTRQNGMGLRSVAFISSIVPFMLKTADNPNGVDKEAFDEMAKAIKADRTHFFSGFFKDFYGVKMLGSPVSHEVLEWSRNIAMQASLKATLACANAFATTDFRQDISHLRVPTSIVHGTEDATVPIDATARVLASKVKNSTLIEYAGAAHGLFATHKERLTKDLLDFVRK